MAKLRPVLEFVNVLEDDPDRLRLSLTKLGVWGTNLSVAASYLGGADWKTQAGTGAMAIAAWVKHEVKRGTGNVRS